MQALQFSAADSLLNRPGKQPKHGVPPPAKLPGEQLLQLTEPGSLLPKPPGQATHCVDRVTLVKEPDLHKVQTPRNSKVPGKQSSHRVCPAAVFPRPGAQSKHRVAPVEFPKRPSSHCGHLPVPVTFENVPFTQSVQADD